MGNLNDLEGEIWKDIPGYEGYYQCSSYGIVKSLSKKLKTHYGYRITKEKILKHYIHQGYKKHILNKNNKSRLFAAHQLVAMCFLGHKPNKYKIVVDHIDNNKLNNYYKNLQLITQRENATKDRKNKSGLTGVSFHKGFWKTQILIKGKNQIYRIIRNKRSSL